MARRTVCSVGAGVTHGGGFRFPIGGGCDHKHALISIMPAEYTEPGTSLGNDGLFVLLLLLLLFL